MRNYKQKDIKTLFARLCCSRCKNEFTAESISVLDKDGDLMICSLKCQKCGKDFGEIVFNFSRKECCHSPLEVVEGPMPISVDDVIDAHKFIKNL